MTTFLVWETTAEDAVTEEMTTFVVQETIAEEDAETAAGSGKYVKRIRAYARVFFVLCKHIKNPLN